MAGGDSWGSVTGFNTAFTKVLSHTMVDHAITGVHLVAVFQQDTYHSGRDPELMEGVIHCNSLASIQGCKRFASFAVTWRHWSGHQYIHISGGLLDQCCTFWQELWS